MADPDLCPRRIVKEVVLPPSRKCTAFQARVLEVKCRRPYSWELPLAVLTDSDTKHEGAEAPLQQGESLLDTTSSADKIIAQSDDQWQDTPVFQLHQTHNIMHFPIPKGAWVSGRWKTWKLSKQEQ
ncbi:hypothetical protein MMC17_005373 [Xylographa soralifera]|nr:hypothetical protein [Xylographa soralifera]